MFLPALLLFFGSVLLAHGPETSILSFISLLGCKIRLLCFSKRRPTVVKENRATRRRLAKYIKRAQSLSPTRISSAPKERKRFHRKIAKKEDAPRGFRYHIIRKVQYLIDSLFKAARRVCGYSSKHGKKRILRLANFSGPQHISLTTLPADYNQHHANHRHGLGSALVWVGAQSNKLADLLVPVREFHSCDRSTLTTPCSPLEANFAGTSEPELTSQLHTTPRILHVIQRFPSPVIPAVKTITIWAAGIGAGVSVLAQSTADTSQPSDPQISKRNNNDKGTEAGKEKGKKGGANKRRRRQDKDDDADESDDGRQKRNDEDDNNRRTKPIPENGRLFACHFAKFDPENASCQGTFKFKRWSDVKQHVLRNHVLEENRYCSTCWKQFPDKDQLKAHIEKRDCRETEGPEELHPDEAKQFRAKNPPDQYKTTEQKWYWIWDELFKDHDQPPSPFVEANSCFAENRAAVRSSGRQSLQLSLPGILSQFNLHLPNQDIPSLVDHIEQSMFDQHEVASRRSRRRPPSQQISHEEVGAAFLVTQTHPITRQQPTGGNLMAGFVDNDPGTSISAYQTAVIAHNPGNPPFSTPESLQLPAPVMTPSWHHGIFHHPASIESDSTYPDLPGWDNTADGGHIEYGTWRHGNIGSGSPSDALPLGDFGQYSAPPPPPDTVFPPDLHRTGGR